MKCWIAFSFIFVYIRLSTEEDILKFYKIEDGKEQVINYQLNGSDCYKLPDKNIKYADTNACVLGFPKGEGCTGVSFLIKNRFEIKDFRDWNDWSFRKCIPGLEHEDIHFTYEIQGIKKDFYGHNGCNWLPFEFGDAGETVLSDKCLIIFSWYDCGGDRGWTYQYLIVMPGELVNLPYKRLGLITIHTCDNHPAAPGPIIHFYPDSRNQNISYSYNVSQETGCVEIDKRWVEAYDNEDPFFYPNGNCIELYYDVECKDFRNTLRDGMTIDSWNGRWLYDFVKDKVITENAKVPKSFTTCKANFVASIFNIEVKLNGSEIGSEFVAQKLGKKEIIYNNGSAALSKYYASKEIMTETTRVNIIESITNFCKSDCLKHEKPLYRDYAAIELYAMIETAYKELFAKPNTTEKSVIKSQDKEVYVSENVDVPPCTKYEIQSIIMFVNDLPTSYVVRVKLSGTFDQERMSVNKLKRFIPKDLEFIKELDNETIEVIGKGLAFRSFATTHILNGNGSPIHGCCVKNTGTCK